MSIRGFVRNALGRAALMLMAGIGFSGAAAASTIYTYSFEQTGYTLDWFGTGVLPATLKGSFTGTADAFHINRSTLSAFNVQFDTVGVGASELYSGLPDYFSFQVGSSGGSSTLAFQTPLPLFTGTLSQACVGAAVSIL